MKLILSCSSEDIEFVELVKKEFSSKGTISECKISGITGYEVIMLVLQFEAVSTAIIIPFIVANMTSNKENRIKSKRCIVDNKNKTISLEDCSEETIREIAVKAIQEQNK